MIKPTIRQLEYAVAVADAGQFGRAAQRLHVAQPSLSAQIAELEASLGMRIFNRGRNGASPTASGFEVIRRARLVLREVEDIVALSRNEGLFGGRLRLGVLPSIGPYLLPEVVRKIHTESPELRLVLKEESTLRLEDDLRSGRLDMIISTPGDHLGTHQVPLFSERLWAAFAHDDPLSTKSGPVSPPELSGRTLLTLDRTHRLSRMVQLLAQQCGATVLDDYQGTSMDAIRLMAATGSGVAILPHIYTAKEARRGSDVELRPFRKGYAERNIALIQSADGEPRFGTDLLASTLKLEAERLMGL
ncbi:MAG: LysR substrate-binding domain-containing protein [Pseudomonadota bacterium]